MFKSLRSYLSNDLEAQKIAKSIRSTQWNVWYSLFKCACLLTSAISIWYFTGILGIRSRILCMYPSAILDYSLCFLLFGALNYWRQSGCGLSLLVAYFLNEFELQGYYQRIVKHNLEMRIHICSYSRKGIEPPQNLFVSDLMRIYVMAFLILYG